MAAISSPKKTKSVRFAPENKNFSAAVSSTEALTGHRDAELLLPIRAIAPGVKIDAATTEDLKNRGIHKTVPERDTSPRDKTAEARDEPAGDLKNSSLHVGTLDTHDPNSRPVPDTNSKPHQTGTGDQRRPPVGPPSVAVVADSIGHVMAETHRIDIATDVDARNDAEVPMTSSSDVKIRYVHMNDRTYSVGGRRADNKLQWYAVTSTDDASRNDVTNRKDQHIVVYQIEGDPRQREHVVDNGNARNSDRSDLSGTEPDNAESLYESNRCLDEETRPSERLRPASARGIRRDIGDAAAACSGVHYQRKMSDIDEEERNDLGDCPSPSSTLTTKEDLQEELRQLKDVNERQAAVFSEQVSSLRAENVQQVLQLHSNGELMSELQRKVSVLTEKNQESSEKISQLTETLLDRDRQLSSLGSKVESLNQIINELQIKNANLLHRAELLAANSHASPPVSECLRPCCLTSSKDSLDSSDNNNTNYVSRNWSMEPLLQRRMTGYHPGKPIGPVRCQSAPVRSAIVRVAQVQDMSSGDSPLGNSKDYFEELFDDSNTSNGIVDIARHVPVGSTVEHSYNTCAASSTCGVRILEVSQDGKYVRIINTSSVLEYEIGGHIIQQNVRGQAVKVFQFPPRVTLPKLGAATVWSESGKQAKSLSNYLAVEFVFKGSKEWTVGPHCTTVLCRPNGQAIAWYSAASHVTNKTRQPEAFMPIADSRLTPRASTNRIDCISSPLNHLDHQQQIKYYNSTAVRQTSSQDNRPHRASSAAAPSSGSMQSFRPAQRLGSASLRRFTPSRPLLATALQNT